jgi:hypothetical protein
VHLDGMAAGSIRLLGDLDRGGNRPGDLIDLGYGLLDPPDGGDGLGGRGENFADMARDLLGGASRAA